MHKLTAVAVCPGPNLAYFSGIYTLRQMVDHIYGRGNLLNNVSRSNMFINEFRLYVDYLRNKSNAVPENIFGNQAKALQLFHANLLQGINYYEKLMPQMDLLTEYEIETKSELQQLKMELSALQAAVPEQV